MSALAPFDVVVSCKRLDDEAWWRRSLDLCNRLRPGGLVVLEWTKSKSGPTGAQVIEALEVYDVFVVSESSEDDEEDENWTVVAQKKDTRKKEKVVVKKEDNESSGLSSV